MGNKHSCVVFIIEHYNTHIHILKMKHPNQKMYKTHTCLRYTNKHSMHLYTIQRLCVEEPSASCNVL